METPEPKKMRWWEMEPNSWFKLGPHKGGTVVLTTLLVIWVLFQLTVDGILRW